MAADKFGGPSPRARGTRFPAHQCAAAFRFIPASAGNTIEQSSQKSSPAVHPRERGEHARSAAAGRPARGSSPRARGTPWTDLSGGDWPRFIPASAGNTSGSTRTAARRSVHPRERGEHAYFRACFDSSPGSSPRARGTRPGASPLYDLERFIPASAGNTTFSMTNQRGIAVHPRERGEHSSSIVQRARRNGSSPRARGTHGRSCLCIIRPRFIPASAGNTLCRHREARQSTVHPRERGEHCQAIYPGCNCHGSSPRARGTPRERGGIGGRGRFIPASAGNTQRWPLLHPPFSVHPRERGEHSSACVAPSGLAGSSPRARGTRPQHTLGTTL